jgi:FdhD protein
VASPLTSVACRSWRAHGAAAGERVIPEETAVAFTYNGGTYAVMMATPQDLEDFAVGFSLTEGIVNSPEEIQQLHIVEQEIGIELCMWLGDSPADALNERRRHMAGPTGCGLCGIESLAEAMRPSPRVRDSLTAMPADILRALDALASRQELNRQSRAMHAAAFWQKDAGLIAVREDVGRHNALDKLIGALLRDRADTSKGFTLITSRASVEMVQKSATAGIAILAAVSAPTALAVRVAESCGQTLVGFARGSSFSVYTHGARMNGPSELL